MNAQVDAGRVREPLVIVVDDDVMVLDTVTALLETAGFMVMPTTSAAEAAQLFETVRADAVVTDLRMPGMDGIELARKLHQTDPDLPVLVMTAVPTDDSAARVRRAGALGLLAKPLDPSALFAILGLAIEERRCRSRVLRREVAP